MTGPPGCVPRAWRVAAAGASAVRSRAACRTSRSAGSAPPSLSRWRYIHADISTIYPSAPSLAAGRGPTFPHVRRIEARRRGRRRHGSPAGPGRRARTGWVRAAALRPVPVGLLDRELAGDDRDADRRLPHPDRGPRPARKAAACSRGRWTRCRSARARWWRSARKPAVVVNTTAGIKAYSAICTHLGCIVAWDAPANLIICPCHDGRFNPATGAVVSGPPPAPLAPLTTAVERQRHLHRDGLTMTADAQPREAPGGALGWVEQPPRTSGAFIGALLHVRIPADAKTLLPRRDHPLPVRHPGRHRDAPRPLLQAARRRPPTTASCRSRATSSSAG